MNRKNSSILILSLLFILTLAIYSTYAFFVMGNFNINNTANVNLITDENNIVFDVLGGQINLTFNASALKPNDIGNIVAQNTTTLTVNFQPNTTGNIVCSYDIVYEWISSDKYLAHSPGATGNEFTVQATLTNNSNVSEGLNYIQGENDFANLVWDNSSTTVVKNAQIDGSGSNISTATWTIISKFYNANADQGALAGKTLSGKFNVANVNCKVGTKSGFFADYLINTAPKSGTDAVSNSPWILTSDHAGEWRYAGKNPDNYISFNGELWRIIGVMPNMSFCTGEYGTETECNTKGVYSLVKIIRNDSIGSFKFDCKIDGIGSSISSSGSNDWSDSQLMLMLNGTNYLKAGYDVDDNQLHTNYFINHLTYDFVADGNGANFQRLYYNYLNSTSVYPPFWPSGVSTYGTPSFTNISKKMDSTSLDKVATVKWSLYGNDANSTDSPLYYYRKENNIDNSGLVYYTETLLEKRAVYWYGKIGLMYPSDYGYATNGNGAASGTYSRNDCTGRNMGSWNSGSYKTYCAGNDWLWYTNITSTAPGSSGTGQWTIMPSSSRDFWVFGPSTAGQLTTNITSNTSAVRPALYLKADTLFSGSGTGKWNDPYIIE